MPTLALSPDFISRGYTISLEGKASVDNTGDLYAVLGIFTPGAKWNGAYYVDNKTGIRARKNITTSNFRNSSRAAGGLPDFFPARQDVSQRGVFVVQ
jgi:hypothetical protein